METNAAESAGGSIGSSTKANIVNPYLKRKLKTFPHQMVQTSISSLLRSPVETIKNKDTAADSADHDRAIGGVLEHSVVQEPSHENLVDSPLRSTFSRRETSGGDVPKQRGEEFSIEQRLPSRTVSFQSAEHLTVSELHTFMAYYSSGNGNPSVRITGVILHRHVMETDASICLVLGDPLTGARPSVAKVGTRRGGIGTPSAVRTPTPIKRVILSTPASKRKIAASTPSSSGRKQGSGLQTTATPSATKGTLGPARTPSNRNSALQNKTPLTSRSSGSKRKMVHVPKTPGTNSLLTRRRKSNGSNYNMRRLSFASPTESAINSLVHEKNILAIINPLQHPQASDCGVGDIVMIIGELMVYDVTASNQVATPFLSQYQKRLERDDDPTVRYLVPRVLRNVNGTNVRLQHDALLRRREHVLQLSSDPHQPGRGPPRMKKGPSPDQTND